MKVHLFIQMYVLSSKIERYHLDFDSNWAISSNILPNILPKKIDIAFEQKIAQKKNAAINALKYIIGTLKYTTNIL
jgi:hypothetical protein